MSGSSEITERFLAVDAFLDAHRALWAPRPFHRDPAPWVQQHPELAQWLLAQPPQWVQDNEDTPEQLPPLLHALHRQAQELCALPLLPRAAQPLDLRLTRGIPGRKLSQIQAFAQVATPRLRTPQIADWCAGKAHLSRSLAKLSGAEVHSYERDADLGRAAESLARAQGVQLQSHTIDLLAETPDLPPDATLVALHACGALSDRALDQAHRAGLQAVMLAPCCHHKRPGKLYRPRSELGRQSRMGHLDENALRLSTAKVVVATRRMQRIRLNKMRYRAAYRALIPGTFRSGPESWFTGSFEDFAARLSAREGHTLPPHDPQALLAQAQAFVDRARALGIVRTPFRRPIELWLNLDRALALEEQGWRVELGRFCSDQISPRDILILAERA